MSNDKLELKYLHETDIKEELYLDFLRKYYGKRAEYRLYKRYRWYKEYLGFHCLLAILNGEIVGQSCAFKVRMMTPDGETEWWWGCDSFVLESVRGKGIGKSMQRKLFNDHRNFSSIGYSKTNGHIKKLMGANVIGKTYPTLYSVCRYTSILFQLFWMKMSGKKECSKMFLPSSSLYAKYLLCSKNKDITTSESKFTDENISFIDEVLRTQYDYFVIRDKEYLNWKYESNPSVEYRIVEIRKSETLVAVVIFSPQYNGNYLGCPIRLCKLYDCFIKDSSIVKDRDIIQTIVSYFSQRGQKIDGIYSNQMFEHPFKIRYPREGKGFLSSYQNHLEKHYFSLSDQDLDQLRYLKNAMS